MKKLLEAILIHTSYNFDIQKIPEEISSGLGLKSAIDLFKLSPFNDNAVAVLLDTSTMNGSVHRVFSFHFANGRISIPITDPETGDIAEKFEDYNIVLEESSPYVILENLNAGNKSPYYQFPPLVTRAQIKNLLSPKNLLPIVATIVRFSARWITERSLLSFRFWEKFYAINTFYNYIAHELMSIDIFDETSRNVYEDVIDLIANCNSTLKKQITELVNDYFTGDLSYVSLKNRLLAYNNFEFYLSLKPDAVQPFSNSQVAELLEKKEGGSRFLGRFSRMYSIIQTLLSYFLRHAEQLNANRINGLKILCAQLKIFQNINESINHDEISDVESFTETNLIQVVCLYNIFIRFLDGCFEFKKSLILRY